MFSWVPLQQNYHHTSDNYWARNFLTFFLDDQIIIILFYKNSHMPYNFELTLSSIAESII